MQRPTPETSRHYVLIHSASGRYRHVVKKHRRTTTRCIERQEGRSGTCPYRHQPPPWSRAQTNVYQHVICVRPGRRTLGAPSGTDYGPVSPPCAAGAETERCRFAERAHTHTLHTLSPCTSGVGAALATSGRRRLSEPDASPSPLAALRLSRSGRRYRTPCFSLRHHPCLEQNACQSAALALVFLHRVLYHPSRPAVTRHL